MYVYPLKPPAHTRVLRALVTTTSVSCRTSGDTNNEGGGGGETRLRSGQVRKLQLPVTLTGSAGCTEVTELAAELEAILLTETDRGHGLVHQGTVTCCHHVTTKAGVESC